MICKGYGSKGDFLTCLADLPGQYISYRKQSIKVYHCGEHTCPVIKSTEKTLNI